MTINQGYISRILYNHAASLPIDLSYRQVLLFLFEWTFSLSEVLEGRPGVPVEGLPENPEWAAAEREIRETEADRSTLFDVRFARQETADLNSIYMHIERGAQVEEGDNFMGIDDPNAAAYVAAYFANPNDPRRHMVSHEMAHAIHHSIRGRMALQQKVDKSGSMFERTLEARRERLRREAKNDT